MLREITFEEIYPIWERLWPGRDKIKPVTTMIDHRNYDMDIYDKADNKEGLYAGVFWGIFTDDTNELVAVNSGHQTSDTHFRSRGLYVKPGYAGKGLAQVLLTQTINCARENNFSVCWSIPRKTAYKTYRSAGFTIHEEEEYEGDRWVRCGVMEKGLNSYATIKLK